MVEITTIGLDVAKQIFRVHGVSSDGKVIVNRQLRRSEVLLYFGKFPGCVVGLEACGGSHYWAREITALGHDVRLIPPGYVKPYVKRGKTDAIDAEAICDAVSRPTMRFCSEQDGRMPGGADGAQDPRSHGSPTDPDHQCLARAPGRARHCCGQRIGKG